MLRAIGHLDLDYFFAQVEEVENPALKGLPVVVCVYSGRTEESGVVSTANYRARDFGVKSGIPIYQAKQRLKDTAAVFVPMNQAKYKAYSERIMESLRSEFEVEQTGIDEAFFDLTRKSEGDYIKAGELASRLKSEILKEEGLTCSIGIAPNKVVAKIASDFKKPNGLTIVRPSEVSSFLSPLPIDRIPGVGPKMTKVLRENGVESIHGLADYPVERLEELLGRKFAIYLHNAANGQDDEPLATKTSVSQLSRIITLKADTSDPVEIFTQLSPSVQDVHERLVAKNLFFRTVAVLGIRPDLTIHSRSHTLETATNDFDVLSRSTKDLLSTLTSELGELRRAGVRASDLVDVVDQQSLGEFMS